MVLIRNLWNSLFGLTHDKRRCVEALGLSLLVLLSCQIAYGKWPGFDETTYPWAFLLFPPVILAALRFGVWGAALASAFATITGALGVIRLQRLLDWWDGEVALETWLVQGSFSVAIWVTALLAATVHSERWRTEKRRQRRERRRRTLLATLRAQERLLGGLLELQQQERKIMAHGIHDGMVQYMVGALMSLDSPALNLPSDQAEALENLDVCRQLIRMSVDESRHLIRELNPLLTDESGIVESIELLIHDQGLWGGEIQFVPSLEGKQLPPLLEASVFRIVQEALTNIRKHSQAKRVTIQLTLDEENLRVAIEDDGIGFDISDEARNHFGVESMIKRAHLFGGRAVFDTAPGKGTKIHVVLPLPLPRQADVPEVESSVARTASAPTDQDANAGQLSKSSSVAESTSL